MKQKPKKDDYLGVKLLVGFVLLSAALAAVAVLGPPSGRGRVITLT